MKKQLLTVLTSVFLVTVGHSQTDKLWSSFKGSNLAVSKTAERASFPTEFKLYELNIDNLKQDLSSAKDRFTSKKGVFITLPNSENKLEKFEVFEASNFEPALQERFPEIRSYVGRSTTDSRAQLRLSISPKGIQTTVFRVDKKTEFMEPYSENGKIYAVYNSSSQKGKLPFTCGTVEDNKMSNAILSQSQSLRSNNQSWKTMRLALSCNGEYTTFHGGTVAGALAAFNATMTRVNGVLEKDLALHLNIINNTSLVIFTDAATDPYSTTLANWNAELQNTLSNTAGIGNAAYDIGHMFGATGGGGNAGCIGCVCVDDDAANLTDQNKGSGITSPADGVPQGDTFDIDYVAHEIGHQLGGNHTFSHSAENSAVNVEPGSGSTIMGYAGITGSTDVQSNSDDYYTYRSILQIQNNLATKTCPVSTPTTNLAPVMNAGSDWTIPKGTPFVLTGTGTDPGNTLSYCWEQNNDATTVGSAASFASPTKANGPNFRSFRAKSIPVRYFPELSKVLANTLSTSFESVYTIAKTGISPSAGALRFTLTGRDNAVGEYQTNTDETSITVSGTQGPFDVTSQNTDGVSWDQGSPQTITWTVNGTETLVGSSTVDILLSTDGGLTFPTVLVSGTANDGSENILAPNILSTNARVMVKPTGNIFYDINTKAILIGYSASVTCNSYTVNPALAIPDNTTTFSEVLINVPTTANVSDVNLGVNVDHAWVGDVVINLVSPLGTERIATSGICGSNDFLNCTFDDQGSAPVCAPTVVGNIIPNQSFSNFNGQNPNGNWKIKIRDKAASDTGTLVSLVLTVCSQVFVLSNKDFEFENFTLFPNPNNGTFTVRFTSESSNDILINVNDLRGRQVFEKKYSNNGAFNQNVNLDKLQAGVYLVSIVDGAKKTVKRIVIE